MFASRDICDKKEEQMLMEDRGKNANRVRDKPPSGKTARGACSGST